MIKLIAIVIAVGFGLANVYMIGRIHAQMRCNAAIAAETARIKAQIAAAEKVLKEKNEGIAALEAELNAELEKLKDRSDGSAIAIGGEYYRLLCRTNPRP